MRSYQDSCANAYSPAPRPRIGVASGRSRAASAGVRRRGEGPWLRSRQVLDCRWVSGRVSQYLIIRGTHLCAILVTDWEVFGECCVAGDPRVPSSSKSPRSRPWRLGVMREINSPFYHSSPQHILPYVLRLTQGEESLSYSSVQANVLHLTGNHMHSG
jgi:hypothetical protein